MSEEHDEHVADMMDDRSCLYRIDRNQRLPYYDGHCAICDLTRGSIGFKRGRRQGYPVPDDVIISSRPCDTTYAHDRMCRVCHRLWEDGRLPTPTTRPRRAIARDDADEHSVSAAAALVALSAIAPMDLDLPAPVTTVNTADSVVDIDLAMNFDTTLSPQHKDMRRDARVKILLHHYSGGSRKKCARRLYEACTETVNGMNITTLPNEHGPPLHLIPITIPRKDTVGDRTMRNRA